MTTKAKVDAQWQAFVAAKKAEELERIISEENLNAEAARSFVIDALKSGAGVRTGHGAGPLNHGFSPKATVFRELANPS